MVERTPGQTILQTICRKILRVLWRATTRLEIEGLDQIPSQRPFLVAMNHLTLLDSSLIFAYWPESLVHVVHGDWQNWISRRLYRGIFIAGQTDQTHAISRAVAVLRILETLKNGSSVLIAPEGERSPTSALVRAETGVAYLAAQAGVPVTPVAIFGQEKILACWKRFRRPAVCMRIGRSIQMLEREANDRMLEEFTNRVMLELARMLPLEYRGVYAIRESAS